MVIVDAAASSVSPASSLVPAHMNQLQSNTEANLPYPAFYRLEQGNPSFSGLARHHIRIGSSSSWCREQREG